jgi:hypothetical protein
LDLEYWSDQGEPTQSLIDLGAIHGSDRHQTDMMPACQRQKEAMNEMDGMCEEKNIIPSKDYMPFTCTHVHTHAHTCRHT